MIRLNVLGWGLIWRVAGLSVLSVIFGFVWVQKEWFYIPLVISLLFLLLVINLFIYVSRTNREVAKLLTALKFEDFTPSFAPQRRRYQPLISQLQEVKEQYQKKIKGKETERILLHDLINEVSVGALILDENFQLVLVNKFVDKVLPATILNRQLKLWQTQLKQSGPSGKLTVDVLEGEDLLASFNSHQINGKKFTFLMFSDNQPNKTSDLEVWVNFGKVVSHELLNGLSPVLSLAETIAEQADKLEEGRPQIAIKKASSLISKRTQTLQQFAEKYRRLHQIPEPKKDRVVWKELLTKIGEAYGAELNEKGIEFVTSGNGLVHSFYADFGQMEQVFSNLVLNSMYALEGIENGKIEISVAEKEGNTTVRVIDNGKGIDKNIRGQVFVPFFTTRETGSGIGLSVVKHILWKHGARIYIADNNPGTRMEIQF